MLKQFWFAAHSAFVRLVKRVPGIGRHVSWRTALNGHVRLSYNLYFLAYFFSRNSIFLSQQISRNSVSAYFFSEANGTYILE